jgi:hypothetical protein
MAPFAIVLPEGCNEVTIIRPEDGSETHLRFPPIAARDTPRAVLDPEVDKMLDRYKAYDPITPAREVLVDHMLGKLGYVTMPLPKTGTAIRLLISTPKGSATLYMDSSGLTSVNSQQTKFALTLPGAVDKGNNRVKFPFASTDAPKIAAAFKEWAEGGATA